jgi:hypothetical protein
MPTVLEAVVDGYAQCYDPRCAGYEQEQVQVTRREVQFSYAELGGDLPGIERSTIAALDESIGPCPYCDGPRIASLEPRPEYPRISGQHPLALLDLNDSQIMRDAQIFQARQGQETAELRALIAQQQLQIERMLAAAGQPPLGIGGGGDDSPDEPPAQRGPGRPRRKDPAGA